MHKDVIKFQLMYWIIGELTFYKKIFQFKLNVQEHAAMKNFGLDLYEGVVRDNRKAGVFEPAISKVNI